MRKMMEIFKRDIRRIGKSPAAIIVAVGMCIIPALYAWFNIAANRDPYGNTANIKVAVANNDVGAENRKRTLKAGEQILEQMEDNDDLGWVFTDEEDAVEGVKSGKYYAAIVIPETFSADLLQIEDGTLGSPEITYYVNEKKNAVAPKITNTGSTTIQSKIEEEFYKVASETIAEELQDLGVSLSDDLETTNDNILGMIADARDNFDEYQKVLADFQATISQGTTQIEHGQGTLVKAVKAADAGSTALQDAKDLLKSSRKNVRSFGTAFDQSLSDGESLLNSVYGTASVKLTGLETTASQAQQLITAGKTYSDKINTDSQAALDNLAGVVAVLGPQLEAQKADLQAKLTTVEGMLAATPDNAELLAKKAAIEKGLQDLQSSADALTQLQNGLTNLQAQNAVLGTALDNFNTSSSELTEVMTTIKTSKEQMDKVLTQGKTTLRDLRSGLNDNLMPGLHSALDTVSGVSGDLKSTLEHASATADQMQGVMDQLSKSLNEGSDALGKTGDTLSNLDERLAGIQNDLETLRASDAYKDILDLQEIDPDAVSEFMTSPIELTTTTFYEVEDYGSGMTPFYTNLALWVGGMVLIALLKQEVDEDEKVKKFTLNQAYFGRKLIFILLSVIQSLIICLGDVYLLKVQCMHPGLFVLTGVVAGLIYLSLIYAVTSAFKHIGRAIFVFLVIIQIPGATGTFPVEMMGGFYKAIYRLMPFTYSNGAMRECIGGLYYNTWLRDMGILAAYLLLSLFIGVGLRPLLLNLNALFDRKLAEADLIIYEENNKTSDLTPELIARALQSDREAREAYCERAARFEKRYPVRKRFGFLAMAVMPLIFLVLMFSVESKLIFLVLWICTLIGVSLYLIWLEYHHERMQKQLKLQGFSDGELLAALKEDRA
ncbi:YhgE/Pip family protein [Candidatus Merdisoma sp. HCP28S3_D10]|uniref:YhgE/Pip family protein n=1 Tax=unclassified Candidatus Merdisoma TaxID=3099611 RepID=UPI003F89DE7A